MEGGCDHGKLCQFLQGVTTPTGLVLSLWVENSLKQCLWNIYVSQGEDKFIYFLCNPLQGEVYMDVIKDMD